MKTVREFVEHHKFSYGAMTLMPGYYRGQASWLGGASVALATNKRNKELAERLNTAAEALRTAASIMRYLEAEANR